MQAVLFAALYFLIVLLASTIGAISGIGGGVIIKPVMDSLGSMGVAAISFLSGCTVLTMSSVSLLRNIGKGTKIRMATSAFLALGAILGGIAGKSLFQYVKAAFGREQDVGIVQAALLLAINIGVLFYLINKNRLKTLEIRSRMASAAIGLGLGVLSSFLGIGGGPINIAVLYYFYSMNPKETALNSLFVIFCSQTASLVTSLATKTVPAFPPEALAVMCAGGVAGSLIGTRISHGISDKAVEKFFIGVLFLLMGINVYNIIRFAFL
ncbi:MAG: sulfite exporter TauE/SafE family protein [Spirochaetes bacterium]|nr:sulfite exporter TauE/SafE family protein [Spirochaetota bacterium]